MILNAAEKKNRFLYANLGCGVTKFKNIPNIIYWIQNKNITQGDLQL